MKNYLEARPIREDANQPGDLIVWYVPQVPGPCFESRVPDVETGRVVLDAICRFSLFEYQNRIKPDYADAAGLARWESNGDGGHDWYEVDDEEEA